MSNTVSVERMEDIERCARCKGRCCKLAPGRFVPEDLQVWGGPSTDVIIELLATEIAAIDCGLIGSMNSKMAPILTLAARGLNEPALDFFHGALRCAHLKVDGCAFPLERRPFECAVIVPDVRECKLPDDIHMEFFWLSSQTALRESVERISGSTWIEEVQKQIGNPRRTDKKIRGARDLIAERGLADTALEVDRIAEMARVIPF